MIAVGLIILFKNIKKVRNQLFYSVIIELRESSLQKNIIMSTNNCTITEDEKEINRNNSSTFYNINDKYNYNLNSANSNYTPLKYKNYNINDLRKESNYNQKNIIPGLIEKNNTNSINNNNNILRFNSYRDNNFHSNLNNELEKNKLKLENEKLIKENILIKSELKDALNQINKIKEQPLILNSNNIRNNDLKEQLSLLNDKINIYEVSLEKTKNLYEKQINYYVQQISNYNILISIVTSFFETISKKYIPNYNFNFQNIYVDKFNSNSNNDVNPLNKSDLEEKFQKIENYIYNIQQELNNYRLQGKRLDPPLSYNQYNSKNENKNEFSKNKNREENDIYSAENNNNSFMKNENIFENEIIAKKIRSNSTSRIRRKYSTKNNGNNSCLTLSKKKKKDKSKSKDSKSKLNKNNLDLDFTKCGHKNGKASKIPVNLTIKSKKKSNSRIKIRK